MSVRTDGAASLTLAASVAVTTWCLSLGAAAEPTLQFQTWQLSSRFYCEGADFGDFNDDGHQDIAAGPFIYLGRQFKIRMAFREVHEFSPTAYSDTFFTFTCDISGDDWPDLVQIGGPGSKAVWYENPRQRKLLRQGTNRLHTWKKHPLYDFVSSESPQLADMTGDGKPELLCIDSELFEDNIGYAEADWNNPTKPWTFRKVSPAQRWLPSEDPLRINNHGIGAGDMNGDGRRDILEARGWWEQPKKWDGATPWAFHPTNFGKGGAQMFAYDVDGDGDNDVISSIWAHGYGLSWFEQHHDDNEAICFTEHRFIDDKAQKNPYGVKFSQLHALDLIDMNGDGLKDIITGKRFWAHGPHGDVEPNAAAVLYCFELRRGVQERPGGVDFVPHLVHNDSGVGTQVIAGDVSGDGLPDIVVGNKKGTFVHIHQPRQD